MIFKLLKIRIFARNFNAIIDCISKKIGAWGVVMSYALYIPIVFVIFGLVHTTLWILPIDYGICERAQEKYVDSFLMSALAIFALSSAALFIRFFAQKYSLKKFLLIMALPIAAMFCYVFAFLIEHESEHLHFGFYQIFCMVETLLVAFVLIAKQYSNYRAFQAVGSSLIMFVCFLFFYADIASNRLGFNSLANNAIFFCATMLFWILSSAHILFRDRLLDFLEARQKL